MAAIDVGPDPINRGLSSGGPGVTYLCSENPANLNGTIEEIKIYVKAAIPLIYVGFFYLISGNIWKCRSACSFGPCPELALFTESGLALPIVAGDIIGEYRQDGTLARDNLSAQGLWYSNSGNKVIVDLQSSFTYVATTRYSLYGSGAEPAVGWTGEIAGVTDPASIMGIDVEGIETVKGVPST